MSGIVGLDAKTGKQAWGIDIPKDLPYELSLRDIAENSVLAIGDKCH